MATVINTPATREDSGAGWAAALIIVAALIIIGLFVWPGFVRQSAPAAPGANINVTLPTTGGGDTGGAGGASGMPQ